ncbi:MAG: VacJ family lipoprotein [Pseudomonadota bacterium]
MNKHLWFAFGMALATMPALAATDTDEGFTQPLASLKYLRHDKGVVVFNQATLELLDVPDPWESANRRLYHFNQRVDERILVPVVKGYRFFMPDLLRQGVTNFFGNLGDVSNFSNSLLQLKGKRSLQTGGRLLINTTVGLAGVLDPASKLGIIRDNEDFGQTLGVYGVKQGPYLMLPILGPSNVRDASGRAVDFAVGEAVNLLNVAETSGDHREISAVKIVNEREITEFRYGQLNSPFEYEKLRFVFSRARELQVLE